MSVQGVGEGSWITSYTVADASTNEVLMEVDFAAGRNYTYAPILGGSEIVVTFTVNVFTTGSGNLKIATAMDHSAIVTDRYWELASSGYDLGSSFNPNSASTEFNWAKGTFTMKCYGKTKAVSGPSRLVLVQLASSTGDVLDNIQPVIITAAVDEFTKIYNQQNAKLQSLVASGVAAGYTQMFSNVLNQAVSLANKGYVSDAVALLNSIPSSGEPMPSTMEVIMLPVMGIAVAGLVVFAFLFLRARGKNSYTQLVIEDQIRDLEGLTLRAAKVDRAMASNLDSVKERLKSIVGM